MGEKLYTKCTVCYGTGRLVDSSPRQTICEICGGSGYSEAGIHTGQVDQLRADLQRAIFPGWQSYEQWIANGRTNPKAIQAESEAE